MKQPIGRGTIVIMLICTGLVATPVSAQQHTEDSIYLSPRFMKALENAFSLTPQADTIRYEENFLTREQLHEWVGDVDTTTNYRHPTDTLYLDPRFLGLTPPRQVVSIMFPDFAKDIEIWKSKKGNYQLLKAQDGHQAISGIDVNKALSEMLIPKYRKIRKSRKIAEEARAKMDATFPLGKE